jgi:asparagine synthase (glutamine-hydrolysing)
MCGIFALLNHCTTFTPEFISQSFNKGRNRGPEHTSETLVDPSILLGFHRLAINGMTDVSNQPFFIDGIWLICNGEIYNHAQLFRDIGVTPRTESDCEIIVHLYKLYGIETTLQMLDGVFAFVLVDLTGETTYDYKVYVARDPFGVRPVYTMSPRSNHHGEQIFGIASEMKTLINLANSFEESGNTLATVDGGFAINPFPPGAFQKFHYCSFAKEWETSVIFNIPNNEYDAGSMCSKHFRQPYFKLPMSCIKEDYGMENIYRGIAYFFNAAIEKRYLNTSRPIACLLSGGLDSSSVAASINEIHKRFNNGVPLETYSIGLEGSEDLRNARVVAKYLGTNHFEIVLKEEDFIDAIEDTIYNIESYDTTTVRASIPNSLLCQKIAQSSDAKVIFNGDGADELFGGYIYEYAAPDARSFDADVRRLLSNIWKHDVRRSDGSISSHGLEARTPFLDRSLVNFVLSIDPSIRFHVNHGKCEKYLFREAFSKKYVVNSNGEQLLPDSILWRPKEAFSDGVSASKCRSLYQVLQEGAMAKMSKIDGNSFYHHLPPTTVEQKYYRYLFEKHFPKCEHVVPDFWLPRFVQADDPSARTLEIYKNRNGQEVV